MQMWTEPDELGEYISATNISSVKFVETIHLPEELFQKELELSKELLLKQNSCSWVQPCDGVAVSVLLKKLPEAEWSI